MLIMYYGVFTLSTTATCNIKICYLIKFHLLPNKIFGHVNKTTIYICNVLWEGEDSLLIVALLQTTRRGCETREWLKQEKWLIDHIHAGMWIKLMHPPFFEGKKHTHRMWYLYKIGKRHHKASYYVTCLFHGKLGRLGKVFAIESSILLPSLFL